MKIQSRKIIWSKRSEKEIRPRVLTAEGTDPQVRKDALSDTLLSSGTEEQEYSDKEKRREE